VFHQAIRDLVATQGTATDGGSVYCAQPFSDMGAQAELASVFAAECDRRISEAEEEGQRQGNMGTRRGGDLAAAMQAEAGEARVERDTWALLDVMARADLLSDLDEAAAADALCSSLQTLDPSAAIRAVVDMALSTDQGLKRLRVLQVWTVSVCSSNSSSSNSSSSSSNSTNSSNTNSSNTNTIHNSNTHIHTHSPMPTNAHQ
jgi:hypothetical protein